MLLRSSSILTAWYKMPEVWHCAEGLANGLMALIKQASLLWAGGTSWNHAQMFHQAGSAKFIYLGCAWLTTSCLSLPLYCLVPLFCFSLSFPSRPRHFSFPVFFCSFVTFLPVFQADPDISLFPHCLVPSFCFSLSFSSRPRPTTGCARLFKMATTSSSSERPWQCRSCSLRASQRSRQITQ